MKINQIIVESQQVDEGPIWQGVKGAFSANPIAGAKAGYQQGKGQEAANAAADVSIKQWNAIAGQLNQAGTPATLQQFTKFVKQAAPTSKLPPPTEADMTPKGVIEYIRKAAAQHIANSALGPDDAAADTNQSADPADPKAPVNPDTNADAKASTPSAPAPKATMTKDQISQWISRNSEDADALKSFLDGIGTSAPAAAPAPAAATPKVTSTAPTFNAGNITQTIPGAPAKKPAAPTPNFSGPATYGTQTTSIKPMQTKAPAKSTATV